MTRVRAKFTLEVEVDKGEYEDIVGGVYASVGEARSALEQTVTWSLEENVGGWCDLGRGAEVQVSALEQGRWVNVYLLERLYGGPEEGGWWYDAGIPRISLPIDFLSTDDVEDLVEELEEKYPDGGKRSSVLYGEGGYDYQVVIEDKPASYWPEEAPHYE